jgi:L-fuculose-phosphate aldolase
VNIERDKSEISLRVDEEIDTTFNPNKWTTKEALILTARILASNGHFEGLAGQCTARGPKEGTYWTFRLGIGFDEATHSYLVLVDDDLNVLEGEGIPNPATRFHTWVYRKRPDVNCIVHTHPPALSALSMTGKNFVVGHMDATPFYDNCAWLPEWPGLPIADDEGRIISGALGDKLALLLAHHGLLVAGRSIEEAAYLAVFMERAAELQLKAAATGEVLAVPGELAREARDFLLKPSIVGLTFAYWARRIFRNDPNCLLNNSGKQINP